MDAMSSVPGTSNDRGVEQMWILLSLVAAVFVVALCVGAVGVWVFHRMCTSLRIGHGLSIRVRGPEQQRPTRRVG